MVKKTIYNTYYELVASVAVVPCLCALAQGGGDWAAIAFLLGTLVKFVWSWQLTKRFTKINFSMLPTSSVGSCLVAL